MVSLLYCYPLRPAWHGMGKGNKSRWQAFWGGGWREMMFVFYFGKFFGVCGAFFGCRISERGAVGILGTSRLSRQKWPNCPHCLPIVFGWLTATGRWDPCGFTFSCPIEYFGCSCSYTLQLVQILSRIALWLPYYDHFLCQIRFLFTSSSSLALNQSIKLILHRCINSLQRSLNSSYKVTSFITSWKALLSKGQLRTMFGQANILRKRCD